MRDTLSTVAFSKNAIWKKIWLQFGWIGLHTIFISSRHYYFC